MRQPNNSSDEQGGTWRTPRSSTPPPCDDTPEICSMWQQLHLWLTCACPRPLRYSSPVTHLPQTHRTHTEYQHHRGQQRGFSLGWGARRCPRALIFTSPTMTLCNWWHKWPPAARLLPRLPPIPIFLFCSHHHHPSFSAVLWELYFSKTRSANSKYKEWICAHVFFCLSSSGKVATVNLLMAVSSLVYTLFDLCIQTCLILFCMPAHTCALFTGVCVFVCVSR